MLISYYNEKISNDDIFHERRDFKNIVGYLFYGEKSR
jgi:hypothetical protein